jgi:nucleolar GTP-binding protein
MFRNIPDILTAEEILEISYKKTKKVQASDKNALYKHKKTIIAKTKVFSNNVISVLERYVKRFPSINNLNMFYQDIIDIRIDVNKLRKSLGAIDWAKKTCLMIYTKQSRSLKKSKKIYFLKEKQNEIYGRISSVVKQVGKDLEFLSKARTELRVFPEIRDIPTVVIAGYPNVGKSSLLRRLSSAKPEIARYPFTTKEIHVGHIERAEKHIVKRVQVIDTPGLLDRPLSERNNIEKQAIAALTHLADIIVFLIDVSETSGYAVQEQNNLLKTIETIFKDSNVIIVENKVDVKRVESQNFKISCKTGEGIGILIDKIYTYYDMYDKK